MSEKASSRSDRRRSITTLPQECGRQGTMHVAEKRSAGLSSSAGAARRRRAETKMARDGPAIQSQIHLLFFYGRDKPGHDEILVRSRLSSLRPFAARRPVSWSTTFIDRRTLPRSSKPMSLTLTSAPSLTTSVGLGRRARGASWETCTRPSLGAEEVHEGAEVHDLHHLAGVDLADLGLGDDAR